MFKCSAVQCSLVKYIAVQGSAVLWVWLPSTAITFSLRLYCWRQWRQITQEYLVLHCIRIVFMSAHITVLHCLVQFTNMSLHFDAHCLCPLLLCCTKRYSWWAMLEIEDQNKVVKWQQTMLFSRPGWSQGLLYKHWCYELMQYLKKSLSSTPAYSAPPSLNGKA